MERSSVGEDEISDNGGAPSPALTTKRKRPAIDIDAASSPGPGGVCNDDTVGNILARLPARSAIACTALSKHHRSLIRSREFSSLHRRLGAPLPSPNIAYLATAPIRRRSDHEKPTSLYHGFHLAGAGLTITGNGGDSPPIHSLAGWRYLGTKYINACNGVVLLAPKGFSNPCRCTLWNPALADAAREANISEPSSSEEEEEEEEKSAPTIVLPDGSELWKEETQFMALGFGYGPRSNAYKLLLCRRDRFRIQHLLRNRAGKIVGRRIGGATHQLHYSLVVHSLSGDTSTDIAADDKETLVPLRTVLSMETELQYKQEVREDIVRRKSLYMDGTIYVLHAKKRGEIIAFDVDDETVQTIDMPGEHLQFARFKLIEMSGRPCVVIKDMDIIDKHCVELWQLTENYRLEPIHVISCEMITDFYYQKIAGVWDCGGGILFLWFNCPPTDELLMYDVTTKKTFRVRMPRDLSVKKSDYKLCWGYKPTLVSPESIVGEFSQDMERRRGHSAHITEVINPILLQDRRKGQEATLNTVCLMEFLVRIMQKLPHDLQDIVEMPKVDSKEPGSLFQCIVSSN